MSEIIKNVCLSDGKPSPFLFVNTTNHYNIALFMYPQKIKSMGVNDGDREGSEIGKFLPIQQHENI
jgi:hypothetical protein